MDDLYKDITIEKFNVPDELKNYRLKIIIYNRIELYLLERM